MGLFISIISIVFAIVIIAYIYCQRKEWRKLYDGKIEKIDEVKKDVALILDYLKVTKESKRLFISHYDGRAYYEDILKERDDSLFIKLNRLYDYLDIELKSIPAKPEEYVIAKKVKAKKV